jgi:hypothetical protein
MSSHQSRLGRGAPAPDRRLRFRLPPVAAAMLAVIAAEAGETMGAAARRLLTRQAVLELAGGQAVRRAAVARRIARRLATVLGPTVAGMLG